MKKKSLTSPKTGAKPSKSNTATVIAKRASAKPDAIGAASDTAARSGSKQQMCLDLLGRRNGATLNDLSVATGWQPHSVRGFLSGTVKKKLGYGATIWMRSGGRAG